MSAMLKSVAALTLCASLLSGCINMPPGHLYPVQGALAAQTPTPIYSVSLSGGLSSGTVSASLTNGDVTGAWHRVSPTDTSAGNLAAQWDAVYGQGYFLANVLGNANFCRAALIGAQGLHLDVEFVIIPVGQVADGKGVAADNQGNLYKLTF
jgi:hypothetical protein